MGVIFKDYGLNIKYDLCQETLERAFVDIKSYLNSQSIIHDYQNSIIGNILLCNYLKPIVENEKITNYFNERLKKIYGY